MKIAAILNLFQNKLVKTIASIQLPNNTKAIHDARVIYKKIRAINRLVQIEKSISKKKIHQVYQLMGNIRELQIVKSKFKKEKKIPANIKTQIIEQLQQQEKYFQKKLIRYPIHNCIANYFKKNSNQFNKNYPNIYPLQFISNKLITVQSIVQLENISNTQIHEIRKILKDVMYVIQLHQNKNYKIKIPLNFVNDKLELINGVLKDLGKFQDNCNALQVLNLLKFSSKQSLENIKLKWQKDNLAYKKKLIKKLKKYFS